MADVELKPQVYKDPRPKEYFDQFHARVRAGEPDGKVYETVRSLMGLYSLTVFRARGYMSERVPGGPLILAPNHASFMDHFFTGVFVRRRVQFMAKSQMFSGPIASYIYSHGGVFPVRRGFQDEDAFESAYAILERGGTIGMYCEGGRSRNGRMADQAKRGIGRLALQTGAPVVPVAILGSHQVRNWKRLHFPRVTVAYGEPLRFDLNTDPTPEQQQAAAGHVLHRIRELHSALQQAGHSGAGRLARAQTAA